MSTRFRSVGAALAVALFGAGCEQGNAGILAIEGNVVPMAIINNNVTVCSYLLPQAFYLDGTLDLAMSTRLTFAAYLRNNLVSATAINQMTEAQLRQDGNTIQVTGAHVVVERPAAIGSPLDKATITTSDGKKKTLGPILAEWDVPTTAVIYPTRNVTALFEAVPHQLAPGQAVGKEWQDRVKAMPTKRHSYMEKVILRITVTGTTVAGNTIASGEITYPVTLCWGCLIQASPDPKAETPDDHWQACSSLSFNASAPQPCAYGNYDAVPCGLYCAKCKVGESTDTASCDAKFCPPPK